MCVCVYMCVCVCVCVSVGVRRAKAGRPARTYIQQLCEDTGCIPEDLPEAMNDREKWREKVRDICASDDDVSVISNRRPNMCGLFMHRIYEISYQSMGLLDLWLLFYVCMSSEETRIILFAEINL